MDREKILESTLAQIERAYGKGAIMKLNGEGALKDIESVSTGSLELDMALGIGGIPRGRVTEIFGPESSGKTTLALHIIANAQKAGGIAAFIDAEHALDPIYAKNLGVNTDELLLSQPDSGEQALDICEILLKSSALDIIVIDSVAALVPRAELEGEMGDSFMGLQARLMSQALRKLTGLVSKTKTIVIFINQLREKIGVMFGNPEVTPGGRALKFYGTEMIGSRVKVKVVKNKVAAPFKIAEFDIMFGKGISREGSLVDLGSQIEVIGKSGSWYSYKGERIGQGRENTKLYLAQNSKLMDEIEKEIKIAFMAKKIESKPKKDEEKSV